MNSKWITGLHVKGSTVKVLKDNIGKNLNDPEHGDGFLDKIPKAWHMKEIKDKLGFIKIKNSVLWKISREWDTSHRLGERFAKDPSDKGLLSNIYKEHLNLKDKKANNPKMVILSKTIYTVNVISINYPWLFSQN